MPEEQDVGGLAILHRPAWALEICPSAAAWQGRETLPQHGVSPCSPRLRAGPASPAGGATEEPSVLPDELLTSVNRLPCSELCPHCRTPTDADASASAEIRCEACGANFRVDRGLTTLSPSFEDRPTLGNFELLELVGEGAFGSVFKAHDRELGRTVAVKVPRRDYLGESGVSERFLREARSVAQLRHPSIVPVLGCSGATRYSERPSAI